MIIRERIAIDLFLNYSDGSYPTWDSSDSNEKKRWLSDADRILAIMGERLGEIRELANEITVKVYNHKESAATPFESIRSSILNRTRDIQRLCNLTDKHEEQKATESDAELKAFERGYKAGCNETSKLIKDGISNIIKEREAK